MKKGRGQTLTHDYIAMEPLCRLQLLIPPPEKPSASAGGSAIRLIEFLPMIDEAIAAERQTYIIYVATQPTSIPASSAASLSSRHSLGTSSPLQQAGST